MLQPEELAVVHQGCNLSSTWWVQCHQGKRNNPPKYLLTSSLSGTGHKSMHTTDELAAPRDLIFSMAVGLRVGEGGQTATP